MTSPQIADRMTLRPVAPRTTSHGATRALLFFLVTGCSQPSETNDQHSEQPPDPLTLPSTPENTHSTACRPCHQAIAEEWQESLHAQAFVDPVFSAEYDRAPEPSCTGCHDPSGGADQGISCATCHVRQGQVMGHDSEPLRGEENCRPCHEFSFESDRYQPGQMLQRTFSEWESSLEHALGEDCLHCHMPIGEEDATATPTRSHHRHDFPGFADAALWTDGVGVRVSAQIRDDHVELAYAIRSRHVGHALPTGDMFRQLRFSARVTYDDTRSEETSEEQMHRFDRYFAYTLADDQHTHRLEEVDDTRIRPGETRRGTMRWPIRRDLVPGDPVLRDPASSGEANSEESPPFVDWTLDILRLPLEEARARGLTDAQVRHSIRTGRARVTSD